MKKKAFKSFKKVAKKRHHYVRIHTKEYKETASATVNVQQQQHQEKGSDDSLKNYTL